MARELDVVVPGRLDTLTGGYGYDRRVVTGLRARGWVVTVHELAGDFPHPDTAARRRAAALFATIPDGSRVLIDGLALGALPEEVAAHGSRLHLIALVHHPLAAETGLDSPTATRLEDSERRALTSVRHVVVTSEATAALLASYDVSPDRITVINPGTDPATVSPGSGSDTVHLLCVATLVPRKGHDVLLQALALIRERHWRLTCVGSRDRDSATASSLHALAITAGIADRVALVGERDTEALDIEYATADVFVLPTRYEGYGMAVAEALARGLPIVASRTGAIGDIVGEEAGLLVEPGDVEALAGALRRVLGDGALRDRLAAGARRRRAHLPTWDESCARMDEVLSR